MPRLVTTVVWCAVFAIALMQIPMSCAQQTNAVTPGPVPAQIMAAKKVFVSNATGETTLVGSRARAPIYNPTYDEFYAALKSWGRYELVSAPADADLIFELHFNLAGGVLDSTVPITVKSVQFQVVILDPKTHVLLWEVTQGMQQANRDAAARKNHAQAMTNLIESVKKLSAQPVAAADSASK
jgi:hypothetical protein